MSEQNILDAIAQLQGELSQSLAAVKAELNRVSERLDKLDTRFSGFELRQHHDMQAFNAAHKRLGLADELLARGLMN